MSKTSKKRPYLRFFCTDWRGDAGLRAVGFAARGLWIDMLTIMHEADEYGHLIVNGKAPDARRLASMLGGAEREVAKLLAELESEGIFSRRGDGVIFSRRMLRDLEKELSDIANGKGGGNPKLKVPVNPSPIERDNGGVNPPDNHDDNGEDNGEDKAHAHPSLPSPYSKKETDLRSVPKETRQVNGTRLPEGWNPDADGTRFARDLGLDPTRTFDRFRDYWRGKPGANGRKLDWIATWRNWCRKEAEDRGALPLVSIGGDPMPVTGGF